MAHSALARLWAIKVEDGTKSITEVPARYMDEVILILKEHDRCDILEEIGITKEEEAEESEEE